MAYLRRPETLQGHYLGTPRRDGTQDLRIARTAAPGPHECRRHRVVHSLEEALAQFPADEEIFIIGGAEIYAQALPLADKFYLTRVHHPYDGDTRFPEWNPAEWRLVACEAQNCGAQYPYPFTFETYLRR